MNFEKCAKLSKSFYLNFRRKCKELQNSLRVIKENDIRNMYIVNFTIQGRTKFVRKKSKHCIMILFTK